MKLSVQYKPDEYNRYQMIILINIILINIINIIIIIIIIIRYEARLHELQQNITGTLVRTSPKRTLYVRALFEYDPHKVEVILVTN